MRARILKVLVATMVAAGSASAQTVYRCGNEYTRVPCQDGKSVDVDDRATSTRRAAEARDFAAREKRLGDDMARDRRVREASMRPASASSLGPAKPPTDAATAASASHRPKKRVKGRPRSVANDDDFVARVPKKAKDPAAR